VGRTYRRLSSFDCTWSWPEPEIDTPGEIKAKNLVSKSAWSDDYLTRRPIDPRRTAMKYVCLVYAEEAGFATIPESELAALDEASLARDEELRRTGHLIVAQALESVRESVTIRVRDGQMSATDGPFAETTEQLGGFVFIEARDMNEAIKIASESPMARYGSVEVRPVMDLQARVRERSGG
jgi:hypothetical protein